MNAEKLKPVQFEQDLASALDSELQRIGAYDYGSGGYAANCHYGYLAVVDIASSRWFVAEGVVSRLKATADSYVPQNKYSTKAWQVVEQAFGEPDFSEVDALLDEVFEDLGKTGHYTQKSPQALVYYKELGSDPCVLRNVPGDYAWHYLETTYA